MTSTVIKFLLLFFSVVILIFCFSVQTSPINISTLQTASAQSGSETRETVFAEALNGLEPKSGDSALLIGFDTDTGDNSDGYGQFYDYKKPDLNKIVANKTFLIVRKGEQMKIAAKLDYIVSPQKNGFVYLGQTRYFEAQPRVRNSDFENIGVKPFGFNYTRIWQSKTKAGIAAAKAKTVRDTKAGIDAEFRRSKDKSFEQNITDYEKLSFVGNGFYVKQGFWAQITGGAAFFQAEEKADAASLSTKKVSGKLKSLLPKNEIEKGFEPVKAEHGDTRFSLEKIDYINDSLYTFARIAGKTHLLGLILVDGNAHRSFLADGDFGVAPAALVKQENPAIDFAAFQKADENVVDVFISPNQNMVVVLTKTEIIGLDGQTKREIFRQKHKLQFNKIVLVEWATNDFAAKWEKELKN